MRTLINVKGIRKYVHNKEKKMGAAAIASLERFLKQSLNQWCENADRQGKKVLMKSTCPIQAISDEALRDLA